MTHYDAYGYRLADLYTFNTAVGFGGQWGYYTDSRPNVREYLNSDQINFHERANPGLVYCRARYYDPANARWLTRDPIGYDGGINLYAYCDGTRHAR